MIGLNSKFKRMINGYKHLYLGMAIKANAVTRYWYTVEENATEIKKSLNL